jgi:dolichyl-phosphate beta-glucosyltransferase
MQFRLAANDSTGPLISLVLPAFNPGLLVDSTWKQLHDFRQSAPGNWELLFVCDGCTDGTAERLRALTRGVAGVRVLSYEQNKGKGYAVRLGLQAARGQWRLFTDFDLAYGFEDINRVVDTLQKGAEVAVASRVHPESRMVLPPQLLGYVYRRRLQSMVFSAAVRWILPIEFGDTQAGLKGFSARAASMVLPRLTCCGFEFDCELLTACTRLGLEVAEVPVTVRYEDSASTTGMRGVASMLRKLWAIRKAWRETPEPAVIPMLDLPHYEAA